MLLVDTKTIIGQMHEALNTEGQIQVCSQESNTKVLLYSAQSNMPDKKEINHLFNGKKPLFSAVFFHPLFVFLFTFPHKKLKHREPPSIVTFFCTDNKFPFSNDRKVTHTHLRVRRG